MKKTWYGIRDAEKDVAEILLYDEIGAWGISAKDFVTELGAIKASTINLRVNSPGGDVFDGVAIYNGLKQHPASINVIVDGLAASSASFITQAGDSVLMAAGSTLMIHEPQGMTLGPAEDHAKMAETLGKMGDTIASLYAGRAGGTEAEWRERMRDESWYRAQEAVDINLADGLVETVQDRNPAGIFNLSKFNNVPDWVPQNKGDTPVENADEPEDEPEDDLPDVDFARAMRIGVGKHLEPELLPECDFVSAIKEGTE